MTTSSCPEMRKKNSTGTKRYISQFDNINDRWHNGHPRGRAGKDAWNKGLKGDERCARPEQKGRRFGTSLTGHSTETKQRLREVALKRHADGWDNKAGRCPKYKYSSPIAGEITVDGSWELATARYFDNMGYNWKRNKKRFSYIRPDGLKGFYTPDFYVEELSSYIEVKGYETDLDKAKWRQFKEPLQVWRQADLELLDILTKR